MFDLYLDRLPFLAWALVATFDESRPSLIQIEATPLAPSHGRSPLLGSTSKPPDLRSARARVRRQLAVNWLRLGRKVKQKSSATSLLSGPAGLTTWKLLASYWGMCCREGALLFKNRYFWHMNTSMNTPTCERGWIDNIISTID